MTPHEFITKKKKDDSDLGNVMDTFAWGIVESLLDEYATELNDVIKKRTETCKVLSKHIIKQRREIDKLKQTNL